MEFRLVYQGPLHAANTSGGGRSKEKHLIRKCFHKQLKELWRQHPDLRRQSEQKFVRLGGGPGGRILLVTEQPDLPLPTGAKTWLEQVAEDHPKCGTHFVPLVSKMGGFTCSLEVLFLRRGNPGDLIASGGDIDNRLKVLLDGLVMPNDAQDMGGLPVEANEDPFFVLLEDDVLITSVSVLTDRLLSPKAPSEHIHDVCLIIHVTVLNPGALFAGDRLV